MSFSFLALCSLLLSLPLSGQNLLNNRDSCKSRFHVLNLRDCSLKELGWEYQRLKKLNNPDCDNFNSDLHNIMSVLGDSLGKSGFSKNEVLNIIGIPDSSDKSDVSNFVKLKDDEDILVYCWRGFHDFLYFVFYDGKVKRSGWWFAYE